MASLPDLWQRTHTQRAFGSRSIGRCAEVPWESVATVGTIPNFSDLTSTSAGSVGTSAVAIDNHNITMTPGTGTGIVITGQFVVDLTIE